MHFFEIVIISEYDIQRFNDVFPMKIMRFFSISLSQYHPFPICFVINIDKN